MADMRYNQKAMSERDDIRKLIAQFSRSFCMAKVMRRGSLRIAPVALPKEVHFASA